MPLSALAAAISERLPPDERQAFSERVESGKREVDPSIALARTLREIAGSQRLDTRLSAALDAMEAGTLDPESVVPLHAEMRQRGGLAWRLSNVLRSDPSRPVYARRLRRVAGALPANAVQRVADALATEVERRG